MDDRLLSLAGIDISGAIHLLTSTSKPIAACEFNDRVSKMTQGSRPIFVPSESNITEELWKTELDRIQVVQRRAQGRETKFWIRLIGPSFNISLGLKPPNDGSLNAVMEVTITPKPLLPHV